MKMNHSYIVIAPPPEWVLNNLIIFEEGVINKHSPYNKESAFIYE